jgi:hypothetical protein
MGGLVDKRSNVFYILAGVGWDWSTQVDMHLELAGVYCVWSTHDYLQFVSPLAWERFGQQTLIYILCPRFHWRGFVNTC